MNWHLSFKILLLLFESPALAHHLHKCFKSFTNIFIFNSFFLLFPYAVCTCMPLRYPWFKINFSLSLIQLLFNIKNVNHLSTSHIHHLRMWTLPSSTFPGQMTNLHPLNYTNILLIFTAIHQFRIYSLSISHTSNPTCANSILNYSWQYTYSCTCAYLYLLIC